MEILTLLERRGINCERIDTSKLSEEDLYKAYLKAWTPSVFKKLGIRRIFGTRRRSGCFFGKGVAALLVYDEDEDQPVDVYPHEELGRTITIKEFLEELVIHQGAVRPEEEESA
jgi:hypothetical protein